MQMRMVFSANCEDRYGDVILFHTDAAGTTPIFFRKMANAVQIAGGEVIAWVFGNGNEAGLRNAKVSNPQWRNSLNSQLPYYIVRNNQISVSNSTEPRLRRSIVNPGGWPANINNPNRGRQDPYLVEVLTQATINSRAILARNRAQ